MAVITHDHAPAHRESGSFFTTIADAVTRRMIFIRTRNELSALSTRELADIGLNRGDIARVSRDAAGLR